MKLDELVSEDRIKGMEDDLCTHGHISIRDAIRTAVREGAVAALERAAKDIVALDVRVLDTREVASFLRALTVED